MAYYFALSEHGLKCRPLHSTVDAIRAISAANVIGRKVNTNSFDQVWSVLHHSRYSSLQEDCETDEKGSAELRIMEKSTLVLKGLIKNLFHDDHVLLFLLWMRMSPHRPQKLQQI